jgi:hypothetical protein
MADNDETLEREFDAAMAKAGLKAPADRRAGLLAAYIDMKAMTDLLRQPRTAASEPSNVYSLVPFMRRP